MTATILTISLGIISVSAVVFVIRMVTARDLPDRMVALDVLLIAVASGIAVQAARTGDGTFLTVMVVAALLGFVGTTLVARFVSRRGP
jgi:multicomponent Na+:H+ antiporter subunit F